MTPQGLYGGGAKPMKIYVSNFAISIGMNIIFFYYFLKQNVKGVDT